jgi:hypothetical protein
MMDFIFFGVWQGTMLGIWPSEVLWDQLFVELVNFILDVSQPLPESPWVTCSSTSCDRLTLV